MANKDIYYGGSFNPFHNGHAQIVRRIAETYDFAYEYNGIIVDANYESIWNKTLMPHDVRVKMICQSLYGDKSIDNCNHHLIDVNDVPVTGTNGSTYEAIEFLLDHHVLQNPVSIVIGADNAENIEKWYRWEELVNKHEFIIITRPGHDVFDVRKFKNVRMMRIRNTLSSTFIRGAADADAWDIVLDGMNREAMKTMLTHYLVQKGMKDFRQHFLPKRA